MTDCSSGDQFETEQLDPEQNLVQRRHERDEQEYRTWCETAYGTITVGPERFHPADVLDKLAPDASRRGRDEVRAQSRTDLEQVVCDSFPAPVAVPFQGFLEGSTAPLTRLYRLRDVWESMIRLLAALVLSEASHVGPAFAPIPVRDGKDQAWRPCKPRDLISDKLATRIGLIEGVLHRAKEVSANLEITSVLPADVLVEVRRLNSVRNGFSHDATKSDKQAQAIIDEAYPVLREVLLDLSEMKDIRLMRIKAIVPGNQAEVERLVGHAQSRRMSKIFLDENAAAVAVSAQPVDGFDRVMAAVGAKMLDLSPFFYVADDDTGHRTRIFEFKRRRNSEWELECVADSTAKALPHEPHEALLARFKSLLGNSGGEV